MQHCLTSCLSIYVISVNSMTLTHWKQSYNVDKIYLKINDRQEFAVVCNVRIQTSYLCNFPARYSGVPSWNTLVYYVLHCMTENLYISKIKMSDNRTNNLVVVGINSGILYTELTVWPSNSINTWACALTPLTVRCHGNGV